MMGEKNVKRKNVEIILFLLHFSYFPAKNQMWYEYDDIYCLEKCFHKSLILSFVGFFHGNNMIPNLE